MKIIRKRKVSSSNEKLPGVAGFWNVQSSEKKAQETPKSSASDSKVKKSRLTGAEQYQKYIDEEDRIRKVEEELADVTKVPTTPDEFERRLMSDKNNSFIWIKYMAFFLDTAEVGKARTIAKKAIATINFREEKELLNVWMAYLNLEIRFGSMDTFNELLRDATQRNDPFKVLSRTLKIFLELEKFDDANKIIETLRKKHRPNPDMWLQVAEAYLQMKNEKMAKEMLPKSLLSLKDQERKLKMKFPCCKITFKDCSF
jgi:rRNA biogenesis protein RRP5